MKIAFYHPEKPLPVKKYGGTERIIFWHMKELAKRGHQIHFIGHPKSLVAQYGINLIPFQKSKESDWRKSIPKGTDIIHLFNTPDKKLDIPYIVTIEGNGKFKEEFQHNTVFISQKHASNHGSNQFIYNGIDLSEYPFNKKKLNWDHFLFLAKASWKVKNVKTCIRVCKKARKKLHIAGGRFFSLSSRLRSYGMADQQLKIKLLKKCDALLFPVLWPEPFGIAIIEAFAMGIPVLGSPYGSLPELIKPSVGAICSNEQEILDFITHQKNVFNSEEIRDYVEQNFSVEIMTSNYLEAYQKIISGEKINQKKPICKIKKSEFLLPF